MAGRPWTRDETLIALNLFCQTPFGRLHARNPEIIAIAGAMDRTPDSLAMKCCNLAAFDSTLAARGIRGLSKGSQLDKAIWDEFQADPEFIGFESEKAIAIVKATPLGSTDDADNATWEDIRGLDRDAITKVRVNQSFFRSMILAGYDNACCVCAMPIRLLLVASHIVPWSVDKHLRMNPRNGLCLCTLHDKAFDCGVLTVSANYTISIHDEAREFNDSPPVIASLLAFDGQSIKPPDRWLPDPELLVRHQSITKEVRLRRNRA